MSLRKLIAPAMAAALATIVVVAPAAQAADPITLNASGSTFIANYIEACKGGYNATSGNIINYGGGGSGAGKKAFKAGTVDLAMTDSLVGSADEASFAWTYVPVIAGPIAIAVNLPSVTGLNLSADTFANIMAGKITKWNDPAIVADNKGTTTTTTVAKKDKKGKVVKDKKGKVVYITKSKTVGAVKLPALPISVFYRSDSSGTSEITTKYLAAASPSVWTKPGNGTFSAAFPGNVPTNGTFQAAAGSDGVANGVKSKPGAITYVEMSYAKERNLGLVSIKNAAGNFVAPTSAGASAFLNEFEPGAKGIITPNYLTKEPGAYPISAFTYAIVRTDGKTPDGKADKVAAVKSLLTYLTQTCVPLKAEANYYAGLPAPALAVSKSKIADIS